MICSTGNAIILSVTAFNDYDAIIRLFTEENGKVTVIAKGIRKNGSKNKGYCRVGALVEYEIFIPKQKSGMGRLKKITTKKSCMSENIQEQTRLFILCEISETFLSDNHKNEQIFLLWKELLSSFPLSESRMRGFLCRFFEIEGLFPLFKKKIAPPFVWDSEYGIINETSLQSAQKKISLEMLKVFHFSAHSPLDFSEKIMLTETESYQWWELFWWYYQLQTEYLPRSKKIYEQL